MRLVSIPANPAPQGGRVIRVVARDGAPLRVAVWPARVAEPKGTVLILQGRAEFIEKYFETIEQLLARGFCVVAFDWRGQGGSERVLSDPRKGHVKRFGLFARDLEAVAAQVLARECPRPHLGLAHSMGAAVALDLARRGKLPVERLVALAPMLGIQRVTRPRLARAVANAATLLGLGRAWIPGGGETSQATRPFAGNPLSSDPRRYARNADVAAALGDGAIGAPTIGWVRGALGLMRRLAEPRAALEIRIPVLVIAGGADTVVSTRAIERFAARLKTGNALVVPGARHELLTEADAIRAPVMGAVIAFLEGATEGASAGRRAGAVFLEGPLAGLAARAGEAPASPDSAVEVGRERAEAAVAPSQTRAGFGTSTRARVITGAGTAAATATNSSAADGTLEERGATSAAAASVAPETSPRGRDVSQPAPGANDVEPGPAMMALGGSLDGEAPEMPKAALTPLFANTEAAETARRGDAPAETAAAETAADEAANTDAAPSPSTGAGVPGAAFTQPLPSADAPHAEMAAEENNSAPFPELDTDDPKADSAQPLPIADAPQAETAAYEVVAETDKPNFRAADADASEIDGPQLLSSADPPPVETQPDRAAAEPPAPFPAAADVEVREADRPQPPASADAPPVETEADRAAAETPAPSAAAADVEVREADRPQPRSSTDAPPVETEADRAAAETDPAPSPTAARDGREADRPHPVPIADPARADAAADEAVTDIDPRSSPAADADDPEAASAQPLPSADAPATETAASGATPEIGSVPVAGADQPAESAVGAEPLPSEAAPDRAAADAGQAPSPDAAAGDPAPHSDDADATVSPPPANRPSIAEPAVPPPSSKTERSFSLPRAGAVELTAFRLPRATVTPFTDDLPPAETDEPEPTDGDPASLVPESASAPRRGPRPTPGDTDRRDD